MYFVILKQNSYNSVIIFGWALSFSKPNVKRSVNFLVKNKNNPLKLIISKLSF